MGNILIRRPLLVSASAPSYWDDEWVYTDGAPTVDEWTRSGSGAVSSLSTGYRIRGYSYSKTTETTNGVIEAYFQIENARTDMNGNRARLRIGDSSNAAMVIFSSYSKSHGIYLHNYSSSYSDDKVRNGTKLGTFVLGDWYKVRITIDGSTGSVEINDEVVASNIDTSAMYGKGGLYFCGSNSSYFGSVWQYVKYKVNS